MQIDNIDGSCQPLRLQLLSIAQRKYFPHERTGSARWDIEEEGMQGDLTPHGLTVRLTVMVCGVLLAPDAVMVTVPVWGPMAGMGGS